jgi:hypothetical protein
VHAVDGAVGEERGSVARGDVLDLLLVTERAALHAHRPRLALRDHPREHRRVGQEHHVAHAGGGIRRERRVEAGHLVAQRAIDLPAQRAAHDEVGEDRAEHDRDRDGAGAREREAAAEAHCSRST